MYLRNSLEHVFLFLMQSLLKLLVLDHFFFGYHSTGMNMHMNLTCLSEMWQIMFEPTSLMAEAHVPCG